MTESSGGILASRVMSILGARPWARTVDLVEEDDGGLALLGLLEQQAELPLALAHPLGQHVRALAVAAQVEFESRT